MRVLWVCNIMLPFIAKHMGRTDAPAVGGWLTGLMEGLMEIQDIDLSVCFPMPGSDGLTEGETKRIHYYGFANDLKKMNEYEPGVEEQLREIMKKADPDVVHIFGTEYSHTLAAVRAYGKPDKTVISIQGMVSIYAKHFMADLPERVQKRYTFRDLIRRDNLIAQRQKFLKRAVFEKEALAQTGHVIGRTDWDRACTQQLAPQAAYHFCNESLRSVFYEKRWELSECSPHTIFVSQGSYPIKGLHYVLEAMPEIRRRYPDVQLRVAGGDPTGEKTLKDKLRISSYGKYIGSLIRKYGLEKQVVFTGFLDEKTMCEEFLRANVFVSPSSIENSPNSVGEAMLLGMPCVSSDVGGVKNLMEHGKEGFVYQADAPYMLAYYVCRIFEDEQLASLLGESAAKKAAATHDRAANTARLAEIYQEICG